jgi:hypothetical protein
MRRSSTSQRRYQRQRHQNGPWLRGPPMGRSPSTVAERVNETKRHRRHAEQRRMHSSGEPTAGQEPWSLVGESQSPRSGPIRVQ